MRIAVIDRDACNPDRCQRDCYRFCPVVRMGEKCIYFEEDGVPIISEVICNGCGICIKKCPFEALKIVNLPDQLSTDLIHQYGRNGFRLFKMPTVEFGLVTGVVGRNGVGKSTALKILSGELKANFGEDEADEEAMLEYTRGTMMQTYFEKLYKREIRVFLKPQAVYLLPRAVKGKVENLLERVDERGALDEAIEALSLKETLNKKLKELSGGELQRVAIAAVALRDASVYLFDEPSSFNDVFQRMEVARYIRGLAQKGSAVLVVEHDLAILDYLSYTIDVVYGDSGVYGIFTKPESVRTGINIFLDGYVPMENIRFRDHPILFEKKASTSYPLGKSIITKYMELIKRWDGFEVTVEPGEIYDGEVLGILGANAIGKTTLMGILSGQIEPDSGGFMVKAENISYKPQYIQTDYQGTVEEFILEGVGEKALSGFAKNALLEPLNIIKLFERKVCDLSGGELQKLNISACLLKEADIYLLDEPSAFIDVEDRLTVASSINRFIKLQGKAGIVVDHDMIIVDLVSDRIIVFEGIPGSRGHALHPMGKRKAFNTFLRSLDVTIRRDKHSGRPRINKPDSRLDRKQKEIGEFYFES